MQDLPTAILYFRRIDRFSRLVLCALQNVIYDLDLRHSDLASVRHSGYLTFSYKLAHRSVFQVKHFAKLFCTYNIGIVSKHGMINVIGVRLTFRCFCYFRCIVHNQNSSRKRRNRKLYCYAILKALMFHIKFSRCCNTPGLSVISMSKIDVLLADTLHETGYLPIGHRLSI